MRKVVVVGVICLIVGGLVGWFSGRFMLERYWTQPLVLKRLAEADVAPSTGVGADPAPKVGALVLRPAPLERARMVLADFTRRDPVVLAVGDVARGHDDSHLNLDLTNRGKCSVSSLSGVAYGYDAYGRPSRMNKGGENYVAFSEEHLSDWAPAATHLLSMKLHDDNHDEASLVLAHVDRVTCSDGTSWAREPR